MKTLIALFLILVSYTTISAADNGKDFTKAYVGFNMGLSEDLIQLDPACNKKPFYPAFGTAYNWLNADKTASSNTNASQTQVK